MKPLTLPLISAYWLLPLAPRAQTRPDSPNAGQNYTIKFSANEEFRNPKMASDHNGKIISK